MVVTDLPRALRFYCDVIGFAEPAVWGEPPCFAMLHRDGFELMLSLAESAARPRANDAQVWDVYVRVADVAGEATAITAAGGTIDKGPTDTVYHMREIEVVDPDGHRWCFAQDVGGETAPQQSWTGTLDLGTKKLRLVLKLTPAAGTAWHGFLDSIDQGAMHMPLDNVQRSASTLEFTMDAIRAGFRGTFGADNHELFGQWTQNGRSWPLTFRRDGR